MSADLHWLQADAGLSFSLLALACGVSSPLPAVCIRWIGVRATMLLGGALLAAGFALAGRTGSLPEFFVALCFMGTAFSLLAPVPGIFLIPRWFVDTAPRVIGFYFTAGAFGGVVGPVMVNTSVALTGSWRVHWYAMAVVALVIAALCFLLARDRRVAAPAPAGDAEVAAAMEADVAVPAASGQGAWTVRRASASRPFITTAFTMLIIQTAITVINSVLVPHVIHLGADRTAGALALGLAGLTGTVAKGIGGVLAQRGLHPRQLLLFSLAVDSAAMALLGARGDAGPRRVGNRADHGRDHRPDRRRLRLRPHRQLRPDLPGRLGPARRRLAGHPAGQSRRGRAGAASKAKGFASGLHLRRSL